MGRLGSILLVLLLVLISTENSKAQKAKFQSIFIYNFSKYVKWPDEHNKGKFIIGILGGGEIKSSLSTMAAAKGSINGMSIEVVSFDDANASSIDQCHILFVSDAYCNRMDELIGRISGNPVLVVTDQPGMAQKGAAINFVERDGKIKFELNQTVAEEHRLKIAGSLASLAILI